MRKITLLSILLPFLGLSQIQIGEDIIGEANNDCFGCSSAISADGSVIAIGATGNEGNGTSSGHVRVYYLDEVLSIEEQNLSDFNIYPNPTKSQFTIQLNPSNQLKEVSIYNTLGQLVLTSEETVINTFKLASGSYIVEITTNKGKASKKLIIE